VRLQDLWVCRGTGDALDITSAGLVDDDVAALVGNARAAVVDVGPVLDEEDLAAAVAAEGQEAELVALLPVIVRT
jgi:hypothetical protein